MSPVARLRLVAGLAALLALALLAGRRGPSEQVAGPVGGVTAPADHDALGQAGVGFRSPRDLDEHFAKHASEFGAITKSDYLRRAQRLRDRPAGGDVLELVRDDGVITRFDRATGEFLAASPDGTIRTFFRPNAGVAYFERQAQRSPTR